MLLFFPLSALSFRLEACMAHLDPKRTKNLRLSGVFNEEVNMYATFRAIAIVTSFPLQVMQRT